MIDYEQFRDFATNSQIQYLDAVKKEGTQAKAAKFLGINKRTLERGLKSLKENAAKRGFSPENSLTNPVPSGYIVPKYSTNYDGEGNIKQQWVSSEIDKTKHDILIAEAYSALSETLPKVKPVKASKKFEDQLLTTYFFSDVHLGLLACNEECGDGNYDLKIAEEIIKNAIIEMVDKSPKAEECIISILGDFLHFDGILPITPISHHILDSDGRFYKVVRAGIRIIRNLVDVCLQHHKIVNLQILEGNHDQSSSILLREAFAAIYSEEKRVVVDVSPNPYVATEHGKTGIIFHHGHLSKSAKLTEIFAAQFPEIWGRTQFRYGHCGHKHHTQEMENGACRILQHQTLASSDSYASRHAWFSERGALSITYDKRYGEVNRLTVRPKLS